MAPSGVGIVRLAFDEETCPECAGSGLKPKPWTDEGSEGAIK